jgi:hypothetical protein
MTFVLFNEITRISIFSGSPAKRLVPFTVPNRSRSDRAVIRVYDEHGNVIETHEHPGKFKSGKTLVRVMEHRTH